MLFTTAPGLAREALCAAAKCGGIPELAVPRVIIRLDAIPLLGTGKTDHVRLKALAADAGAATRRVCA